MIEETTMKQRMQMATKMIFEQLQRELGDVFTGDVADDEGLMKEHKKLLALAKSGQTLSIVTTIKIQNEKDDLEPVEVVVPIDIAPSFWR